MEINSNKAGNYRHTLIMVLGCLIPLVILGIPWVNGSKMNSENKREELA